MSDSYKICLLGPKGCGKSALVDRFVSGNFSFGAKAINGETIFNKKFQVDGGECRLTIHDIASDYLQTQPIEKWTSNCDGFVIVYSIASLSSFKEIEILKEKIENSRKDKENTPIIIVGAQADKEPQRQVSVEQGKMKSKAWSCGYVEVSSKLGENVENTFISIVREIQKYSYTTKSNSSSVSSNNNSNNNGTPKNKNAAQVIRVKYGGTLSKMLLSPDENKKMPWEKVNKQTKPWSEIEPTQAELNENNKIMIDLKCRSEGYTVECGKTEISDKDTFYGEQIQIEDTEEDYGYYKEQLAKKEHVNYIGEFESIGPVIISMETNSISNNNSSSSSSSNKIKCIIRTKYSIDRIIIPTQYNSNNTIKEKLIYIKNKQSKMNNITNNEFKKGLKEVDEQSLVNDLIDLETKDLLLRTRYKIGILYIKENQVEENEMYANVTMSDQFQSFLEFIGNKVELKGFTGYAGGLDVKNNSTGTHSIYTEHRDMKIMFHVSTLMLDQPNDTQRVEKKRHIGNDMVVLLFKEGNQLFDPTVLKSQFLHVFAVVQPVLINNITHYKLQIANKPGVRPYGPFIPDPPLFNHNHEFRDFLLTKLINSQRGAFQSNEFKSKMVTTRRIKFEEMVKKYAAVSKPITNKISLKSPPINKNFKDKGTPASTTPNSSSENLNEETNSNNNTENVVVIGKKLLQLTQQNVKEFEIENFRQLLQSITTWSMNVDEKVFKTQEDQDKIMTQARNLFKCGSTFGDLQDSRKRGIGIDNTKFNSSLVQFREALSVFFRLLKDLSIYANVTSAGSSSTNLLSPPQNDSKQELAILVKQLIDHTFVKLVACITNVPLEEFVFVDLLKSIGKTMKDVANILNEEESKRVVESTKALMTKGLVFKKEREPSVEMRNDLITALKALIKDLKDCIDVPN